MSLFIPTNVGIHGGRNRTRTCDPIDVNDVLYQLSHATKLLHNDIYFSIQEEKSQSKMQQLTNWQILNLLMNEIDSNVQYKNILIWRLHYQTTDHEGCNGSARL